MKLINVSNDFSVESLKLGNKTVEFVHNSKTMENFFPQKTLASIYGVSVDNISKRLKQYSNRLEKVNSNSTKSRIAFIRLKIENSDKPVNFYDFKALTYLAYRINTVEALNMLEWIDSSLNTMFNVATGQLDINTKREKLKEMQKVEEFKSKAYLDGSNALRSVDKDRANELYHLHKVHYHNALNCYDLLVSENDWNDRYDVVIKLINGKIDNTKQLTFDEVI